VSSKAEFFHCSLHRDCSRDTLLQLPMFCRCLSQVLVCTTPQMSPALSIINSIVKERLRLGDAYQGPQRVLLTWAARHKAEFTVLEASLMAICTCGPASLAIPA